mgnify:CR=1 FL=1
MSSHELQQSQNYLDLNEGPNAWVLKKTENNTQKIIEIFDRLASEGSENLRVSMEAKFMAGVRYETMCWDAYFDMEEWINH